MLHNLNLVWLLEISEDCCLVLKILNQLPHQSKLRNHSSMSLSTRSFAIESNNIMELLQRELNRSWIEVQMVV